MGAHRIAVDTGGTFTDFVLLDESSGEVSIAKILSSPADPSVAVIAGVRRFLDEAAGRTVSSFCHGTTVGTNALLEEKGARTGLLVTEGFRGIYEIMEQSRPHGPALFDLAYDKPALLAPEFRTGEVRERVGHRGEVLLPLDEDALRATLRGLRGRQIESIAVCLLFSYLHPAHERRVLELVREELPGCYVSLSSEVLPQIREYTRLSTTVVNAYLQPIVQRYLTSLRERLHGLGVTTGQAYVMQSNGGTATFGKAAEKAAATLLSGPAGGVTAGARISAMYGIDKVITFDMGGTSCDVALIEGGRPRLGHGGLIGGRQVGLTALEIDTVSAGGGTLASVDAQGVLKVGPDSAGSVPGPACYGGGGTRPTVTDANLALGYFSERSRLGGSLALDTGAALAALREHVARPLGLDPQDAARGIVDVVNTQMQEAIKGISTMHGYDLRDFVLVAFGGAGPVHAAALAAELHMAGVIVPAHPGVFSALGLLMADVQHDHVRSRLDPLAGLRPARVRAVFDELAATATAELRAEGFDPAAIEIDRALDIRYAGQGYEVTVPVPADALDAGDLDIVRKAFDDEHLERFGHAALGEAAEIVSYRVTGRGLVPPVRLPQYAPAGTPLAAAEVERRPVRFGAELLDCPVYARERLDVGTVFTGPAVIDQEDTTVVVLPGQQVTVDQWLNLFLAPAAPEGDPR
ncbi:hydantoinase/oxoprolinase family protein [Streptomyces sp. NBC_01476]|uniref:hydantoinase/oxoprolinase family protein n=1 Tax=Streptomyces sp. NBC_01476 TaxID=2903881 RepID=UPI002E341702|nr:hydantoinase/oxoprolinase family protein [Streptomyces sp. NBC_01476]